MTKKKIKAFFKEIGGWLWAMIVVALCALGIGAFFGLIAKTFSWLT